ncbi:hypothetical protein AB7849_15215 [Rhodanobacter sp. 115]|uniref:hypothetical protein n=1 Tax=Rhodanobacter sp. FW021-MT20 TaxID=1162282 RepID=UPI0034E56E42
MSFKTAFQKTIGPMVELIAHVIVFVLGGLAILGIEWLVELLIGWVRPFAPSVLLVYALEGFGDILLLTDVVLFMYLLWVSVVRAVKEIKENSNG